MVLDSAMYAHVPLHSKSSIDTCFQAVHLTLVNKTSNIAKEFTGDGVNFGNEIP